MELAASIKNVDCMKWPWSLMFDCRCALFDSIFMNHKHTFVVV